MTASVNRCINPNKNQGSYLRQLVSIRMTINDNLGICFVWVGGATCRWQHTTKIKKLTTNY